MSMPLSNENGPPAAASKQRSAINDGKLDRK